MCPTSDVKKKRQTHTIPARMMNANTLILVPNAFVRRMSFTYKSMVIVGIIGTGDIEGEAVASMLD
jgi:hypothetical protein